METNSVNPFTVYLVHAFMLVSCMFKVSFQSKLHFILNNESDDETTCGQIGVMMQL